MRARVQPAPAKGRLVYVIGPSGAGKDSIISYACSRLGEVSATEGGPAFPQRFITRPPESGGEAHLALTEYEFERQRAAGRFAMWWRSNSLCYGIGREIDTWLEAGRHVVVNGSREYLPQAAILYPDLLVPVLIAIDTSVLRRRLMARGREDQSQIENRLIRAAYFQTVRHPALCVIANDGALEDAGEAFLRLLSSLS
jgi:ribose 1,5-bisphosphokinase